MVYRHRVTIRVTKLDGHRGSLTASRIVYANAPAEVTAPLDAVLDSFPFNDENMAVPPKPKKK